jgi:hypothetical protein
MRDHNAQSITYVYFEDVYFENEAGRRAAAKLMRREGPRKNSQTAGIPRRVFRERDAAGGSDINDVIVFAAATRAGARVYPQ